MLLVVTVCGCTEIYNPEISSDIKALVVEGMITNEAGPFTIKLSEAKSFSGGLVIGSKITSGAIINIVDNENQVFKLTETKGGSYVTPVNFITKVGNSYKLMITTVDGNKYESNMETLLPPQTYDSINVVNTKASYLNEEKQLESTDGADILIDLFKSISSSEIVPTCRFVNKITVQYNYSEPAYDAAGQLKQFTHMHYLGWRTFNLNSTENITEEKSSIVNSTGQKHFIGFMPFSPFNYGILIPKTSLIYYLRVNQYTTNSDSHRFYKESNNQLSADGKIFDPITSQLHSNIKCINNPSKVILGLFEVSSVKKHAFLVKWSISNPKVSIVKASVMDVPANKELVEEINELGGNDTPAPDWWLHN